VGDRRGREIEGVGWRGGVGEGGGEERQARDWGESGGGVVEEEETEGGVEWGGH